MGRNVTIFHCDDSEGFTRLVRHWLTEHDDLEHLGAAHREADALTAVRELQPDVVLLDTMGNPGEGDLLAAIRAAAPKSRVLVYSGYVGVMNPRDLGDADGHLAKCEDEVALVAAIRRLTAPLTTP